VAIGAWLAGPGNLATKVREGTLGFVRGSGQPTGEPSPVAVFVGRYKTALRVLAVGAGLLLLAALSAPSPGAVVVVAIIVVLLLLLVEFLGRGAPEAPATGS